MNAQQYATAWLAMVQKYSVKEANEDRCLRAMYLASQPERDSEAEAVNAQCAAVQYAICDILTAVNDAMVDGRETINISGLLNSAKEK